MSTPLQFGAAEQTAALRLIDIALAEDLRSALPLAVASQSLAEMFCVTTVDSVLDNLAEPPLSDLDRDLTSAALVDPNETATIDVVVRNEGVLAGSPIGELVFERLSSDVTWQSLVAEGSMVSPQTIVARVTGPLRALLIGERTILNFLMHLSGVATQTKHFVNDIAGTRAEILDTRKTLPGWRLLEKYAVRCGGGTNHRMGLHDGVLIKDNHLAAWKAADKDRLETGSVAAAVRHARDRSPGNVTIEVEVDTLEQLRDALAGAPDIVLLDNMAPPQLRDAVRLRNELAPTTRLEASGGITRSNVREIAETGVDRISIGALTHSAPALDIGFDWHSAKSS